MDRDFMIRLRSLILTFSALIVIIVIVYQWPVYVALFCLPTLPSLGDLIYRDYRHDGAEIFTREYWLRRYRKNLQNRRRKMQESNAGGGNCNKWAELHPDIMDNILRKLSLTQSVKLKTVCKSWCSTVMKLLFPSAAASRVIFPWLFIGAVSRGSLLEYVFYSLSESRHIRIRAPNIDFRNCYRLTTNDGWLMIVESHDDETTRLFLLNPITSTRIHPPPWKSSYSRSKLLVGPSLSFLSTLGDHCISAATANKLIVVTISDDTLVFCRSGDSTWTTLKNPKGNPYVDIAFCKGQLYALDELSLIWVYEFKVDWEERASSELATELSVLPPQDEPTGFKVLGPFNSPPRDELKLYVRRYVSLMECCGDLLLIQTTVFTSTAAAFRVFKLDKYLCQWVEVKNLQGDRTLLLGRGFKHSFPISSPAATASPFEPNFLRKNCIYHLCYTGPSNKKNSSCFLNGVRIGRFEISVFNLEDGSCQPCFPSSFHRFSYRYAPWFSPNLWI